MKKFAVILLAMVMALGLCSVGWATGEGGAAFDLSTAIDAATAENNTITLTDNVTLSKGVVINKSGVDLIIDLGGKTISGDGQMFDIYSPVMFKNGTISVAYAGNDSICAIWLNQAATLKLDKDVKVVAALAEGNSTGGIFAVGFWKDCANAALTVDGTITGDCGVTINGLITDETNTITVNGTINVNNHALYLAGNGTTGIINSGASVSGNVGVEIRAGKLNVAGGTITSTGTYKDAVSNGGGTTSEGVAVAVAEHVTGQGVEVNITGGTINAGANGKAIVIADPESKGGDKVEVKVSGGSVMGAVQVVDSIKDKKPLTVSGGTFTTADVKQYLTSGKQQNADGTVTDKSYYYVPGTTVDAAAASPKTFDTGIALYVGMALTSAAGAVFVGKKREG